MTNAAELSTYLARIGLNRAPSPDAAGLQQIQAAHRRSITFENLDVMLGRGVDIDAAAVFTKLVEQGRGGYCFEHNTLLTRMLNACGFSCRLLLARVELGNPPAPMPRLHCLVLVELEDGPWIADAGFGGSYAPPMRLTDGAHATSGDGAQHRLVRIGERGTLAGEWRLERQGPAAATDGRTDHDGWQAQFSFDLGQVAHADCELGNFWTSTHPTARFTQFHVVSICLEDGFASMVDNALTIYRTGKDVARRDLTGPREYREALAEVFNLPLPPEDVERLPLFAR